MKNYFQPTEFHGWYEQLNPALLAMLNQFRQRWGRRVHVSPHPDAVGRHGGDSLSQHNVDRWGQVNAVDIFPEGMTTAAEMCRAQKLAVELGFSGIGLYIDTHFRDELHPMMHIDVRSGRRPNDPAMWSRVEGEYRAIDVAIRELEKRSQHELGIT